MDQADAIKKLQSLRGQDLLEIAKKWNVTVRRQGADGTTRLNKGWAGQAVERYLGLPLNASQSPNLGSWELKVVPMTQRPDGTLTPKETMAITMLDPVEVQQKDFRQSHLFTKLNRLIIISRLVIPDQDNSIVLDWMKFRLDLSELRWQIEKDYCDIRSSLCVGGELSGKMGKLIQPRTKGQKNSVSRAFYARKDLVEHMTKPQILTAVSGSGKAVCARHAGASSQIEREPLDSLMRGLPENQSGHGRHKCPYCAYDLGFRDGCNSVLANEFPPEG